MIAVTRAVSRLNGAAKRRAPAGLTLLALLLSAPLAAQEARWTELNGQVIQLIRQGKYAEAVPLAQESLQVAGATFGPEHPNTAISLFNLGSIYYRQGRYAEAEPLLQRALAIKQKALGPENVLVAQVMNQLAVVYEAEGKYAEAETMFNQALAITRKAVGPDNLQVAYVLNNLAVLYRTRGRYADAEALVKQSLAIEQKALGPDNLTVAGSLHNLATLFKDQGRYAEAEPLYTQALAIKQKVLGPDHPDVANTMNNLAALYDQEGKYAQAEPLYKQALAIRKKALGPDHPDVASSLNNLAMLYEAQSRYADAEPLLTQALAIRRKVLGPEHPDVAISLSNLAELYIDEARYADAEPLLRQVLAIKQKALGPEHPDVAASLNNLAELFVTQGRYADALPLLQQALAIRQKALGPEHPDVAVSLNNLARLYEVQGRYTKAESLLQQALAIKQKALGPEHPDVAVSLNNLAAFYKQQGRYADAEPLFKRALAITQKAFGPEHPDVALSLDNLATLYDDQGKFSEAERLYQQALAIREKALGPEHPDVASALSNLAVLYGYQGRLQEAESLQERALAIRLKTLGPENPAVAVSMDNLAVLLMDLGRYSEAEPLYKQALAIRQKALGPDHPDVATALNDLATLYGRQDRYEESEPLLKQALAIREKALGPEHPLTGWSERGLGELYYSWGRPRDAEAYFERAFRNLAVQFDQQFAYMSEKERLSYLALFSSNFPIYMSFALSYHSRLPGLTGKMYDLALWQKGMVAGSVAAQRARLVATGDPQALALFEQLAAKKTQLAALRTPPAQHREQWQENVAELQDQANELEKELVRRSPALAEEKKLARPSWREVRDALGKQEAAVEFVRFRFHDEKTWTDKTYYVALVLTPRAAQPSLVLLGEAKDLEAAPMDDFRAWVAEPDPEQPLKAGAGRKFAAAFWEPLAKALGGASRVYISPDGALNQVSLGLAPLSDGRLLMDTCDLRLVSSTKDLLRPLAKPAANTAMLIGNPKFDLNDAEASAALASIAQSGNLAQAETQAAGPSPAGSESVKRSRAVRGGVLAPLPGTQAEVHALNALLAQHGWSVEEHTQTQALEEHVKQVRGPRVLHLATHGFFITDSPHQQTNRATAGEQVPAALDDPMLRSGIFLAGADRALRGLPPASGLENGVLTAFEATQLNLQGTELVVLSACDTGLGEAQAGEGVFGLRRALQEAGAGAVLMSLWSVPDEETRELMELFYTRWLNGEEKHSALHSAQLEERARVKKRYGNDLPYYWGAFVLIGR